MDFLDLGKWNSLVPKAKDFVSKLLGEDLAKQYVYHDLNHTFSVTQAAYDFGKAERLDDEQIVDLILAALFHDTGYLESYFNHEGKSAEIARRFLEEHDHPEERIHRIEKIITVTKADETPETLPERIIRDADTFSAGSTDYFDHADNLKKEWEFFLNRNYSAEEWNKLNLQFLKNHQYYSITAKVALGPQKKKNQRALKKKIKKLKKARKEEKAPEVTRDTQFSKLAQAAFKTALRNHIDLTQIADNKANIMLSINAILITITLSLISTQIYSKPYLLVPTLLLLITCLTSIVFATLVTRPIKTGGKTNLGDLKTGKTNLFFFGNFYKMRLDQYQDGLRQVIDDEAIMDHSVINDLYWLGKALGRKFKQLRYCYSAFMIGMVITVVGFAVTIMYI